jgi:hypothetical protein
VAAARVDLDFCVLGPGNRQPEGFGFSGLGHGGGMREKIDKLRVILQ